MHYRVNYQGVICKYEAEDDETLAFVQQHLGVLTKRWSEKQMNLLLRKCLAHDFYAKWIMGGHTLEIVAPPFTADDASFIQIHEQSIHSVDCTISMMRVQKRWTDQQLVILLTDFVSSFSNAQAVRKFLENK